MTEATLDVTDAYGNIRRDYTAAEIESLSPERRERFTALLSAALDAQEAEAEMVAATRAVTDAVIDLQNAEREHAKAHPPTTFLDELRRMGINKQAVQN